MKLNILAINLRIQLMVFNKIHFSTLRCEMLNILYNNIRLFFADIKLLTP